MLAVIGARADSLTVTPERQVDEASLVRQQTGSLDWRNVADCHCV